MGRGGTYIGEVARQTGLSVHAIRFYENERLLPEAPRTESGYRLYTPENIEELKFIRKVQALGFSLLEIRELLVLRNRSTEACSHVQSLLREKLEAIRAKRRELEAMEKELKHALVECERQLRRRHPGDGKHCPVLVKLGREG